MGAVPGLPVRGLGLEGRVAGGNAFRVNQADMLPMALPHWTDGVSHSRILADTSAGRLTPELIRRPTTATTRIEPTNYHERQAEGGRVEWVVGRHHYIQR